MQLLLKIGLQDCAKLNEMKIMDALCNLLFHNRRRMIAIGLCTEIQYDNGRKELVQCIRCFLDWPTAQSEVSIIGINANHPSNESNEWSS